MKEMSAVFRAGRQLSSCLELFRHKILALLKALAEGFHKNSNTTNTTRTTGFEEKGRLSL